MAEQLVLTTPVAISKTSWSLSNLVLDVQRLFIQVTLTDDLGNTLVVNYPTPPPSDHPSQPSGETLLHALNTANLSTNSLIKRVFTQLTNDGYLGPGSVTGTPQ